MITYEQFKKAVEQRKFLWWVSDTYDAIAITPSDFNAHAFYKGEPSFFKNNTGTCIAKVIDEDKNCYDLEDLFETITEADEETKRRLIDKLANLNKEERK